MFDIIQGTYCDFVDLIENGQEILWVGPKIRVGREAIFIYFVLINLNEMDKDQD